MGTAAYALTCGSSRAGSSSRRSATGVAVVATLRVNHVTHTRARCAHTCSATDVHIPANQPVHGHAIAAGARAGGTRADALLRRVVDIVQAGSVSASRLLEGGCVRAQWVRAGATHDGAAGSQRAPSAADCLPFLSPAMCRSARANSSAHCNRRRRACVVSQAKRRMSCKGHRAAG